MRKEYIERSIAGLADELRHALLLSTEHTYAESAHILGIPVGLLIERVREARRIVVVELLGGEWRDAESQYVVDIQIDAAATRMQRRRQGVGYQVRRWLTARWRKLIAAARASANIGPAWARGVGALGVLVLVAYIGVGLREGRTGQAELAEAELAEAELAEAELAEAELAEAELAEAELAEAELAEAELAEAELAEAERPLPLSEFSRSRGGGVAGGVVGGIVAELFRSVPRDRSTVLPEECSEHLGVLAFQTYTRRGAWDRSCITGVEYARYNYNFILEGSALVTIELTSPEVDTWLTLWTGSGTGDVLDEDDDGGDGTNARIDRALARGTYTIEATTLGGGVTGPFMLTVTVGALLSPTVR